MVIANADIWFALSNTHHDVRVRFCDLGDPDAKDHKDALSAIGSRLASEDF
ncbi:MAG: hypothetical protein ACI9DC_000120 [Gammaproteobacteria bacterium]|jgi:hypothetical protein